MTYDPRHTFSYYSMSISLIERILKEKKTIQLKYLINTVGFFKSLECSQFIVLYNLPYYFVREKRRKKKDRVYTCIALMNE